jgi:hypothetical protein
MIKKLKLLNFVAFVISVLLIFTWLYSGAEIFTKTKILVDKTTELDKMLGVKNEVWVDKFILGLDYTATAIVAITIITIGVNYLLKNKRKES